MPVQVCALGKIAPGRSVFLLGNHYVVALPPKPSIGPVVLVIPGKIITLGLFATAAMDGRLAAAHSPRLS
jgi:hypothetical protein